ncbi:Phosphate ABC transporter periplasmic phosphate-binding protein [Pseudomonas coronafaciens pv. striafaciens]|nr:Phosphate ABC transporter periplasmic phosphate-binding protein [Pseudomonas coronafaciens pv. striafaciens]RMP23342.1 Phosphate ABC transporter periplasmic phosphate-binding protein [Pseudomonas coronafaciens pv. atropurpurea]
MLMGRPFHLFVIINSYSGHTLAGEAGEHRHTLPGAQGMTFKRLMTALTLVTAAVSAANAFAAVDPAIKGYTKTSGVSGNLSSVGSDTLANLMTLWAEAYKKEYPSVNIQIQAAGSSTAPPALTEGTANLGPMSRKMKDGELSAFEQKHGYKPTAIPVAVDALAVFVHKDNPIKGLTLEQVDAIFSVTRLCGARADAKTWGDVGVTGDLAGKPIQLFGRNSVSGTYGYFKEEALCKGDFKANVNEQPGSASVVSSISNSLNSIGYSGIGYKTSNVRTVPLARKEGGEFVEDNEANTLNGTYPLSRFLYVYVNKAPNQPLAPLEAEFIKLVLSRQGQEVVMKDGYIPLPARVVERTMTELGLSQGTSDVMAR